MPIRSQGLAFWPMFGPDATVMPSPQLIPAPLLGKTVACPPGQEGSAGSQQSEPPGNTAEPRAIVPPPEDGQGFAPQMIVAPVGVAFGDVALLFWNWNCPSNVSMVQVS